MALHTHDSQNDTYIAHVRQLDDHERRISDLEGNDTEHGRMIDRMEQIERNMQNVSGQLSVIVKIVYMMLGVSAIAVFGMVFDFIRTKAGG